MRLVAYHDSNGNIVGLAASPSDDFEPAEVTSTDFPGLRRSELQSPAEVSFDFSNPAKINDALDNVVANYKIDNGTLRRKG